MPLFTIKVRLTLGSRQCAEHKGTKITKGNQGDRHDVCLKNLFSTGGQAARAVKTSGERRLRA